MTGLLFNASDEKTTLGIVTGIQGGRIPRIKLTRPTIFNDGTDDIYLRYFGLIPAYKSHNQISLNGVICNAEDYIEDVQKGYLDSISLALNNKKFIIDQVKQYDQKEKAFYTRFLCLVTACYSRYIALLQHHVSSSSNILSIIKTERYSLLGNLDEDKKRFIIENELGDLCIGVIPYFLRKSNSTDLFHTSGAIFPNFFEIDQLSDIYHHIDGLSKQDVEEDLTFIKNAILSTRGINSWDDFLQRFKFPQYSYNASL